jgi:hypothetical protein
VEGIGTLGTDLSVRVNSLENVSGTPTSTDVRLNLTYTVKF